MRAEVNPLIEYVVTGELRDILYGLAAYEFFHGKTVTGMHYLSRVD
jgi:hypothetical protein